jgi:DNA (cytosine-5)-methyltransferase 1
MPTNGNPDLWKGFSLPFEHLSRIGNKSASAKVLPHVSFEDACGDLPAIDAGGDPGVLSSYVKEPQNDFQRLMRQGSNERVSLHYSFVSTEFERSAMNVLTPGQNWTALPDELKVGRFSRIRSYDATTLLRRLSSGLPSYTINTKFNDATTGAYIHPEQNRTLSIREAARLQSFQDGYRFEGSLAEIRKQIGNAVPTVLAERIARAIRPAVRADMGLGQDSEDEGPQVVVDPDQDANSLIGLKAPRPEKRGVEKQQLGLFGIE